MASASKPSGSKRKLEWSGIVSNTFGIRQNDIDYCQDDAFSNSKKSRSTKAKDLQFGSSLDFSRPKFEPRSAAAASKRRAQDLPSLHANISDFARPRLSKSLPLTQPVPKKEIKTSGILAVPQPPPPLPPDARKPDPRKALILLSDQGPPTLGSPFEQSKSPPSTPKPLKSALKTPLIPGAFASPPGSQKLEASLSQILGERSPQRPSFRELELSRGLAPSPEKGSRSPKKTFARGGLADRASAFINRAGTDFSLWYQDVISSSRVPEPSMHLKVREVVCRLPSRETPLLSEALTHGSAAATAVISVLTRCHVAGEPSRPPDTLLVLFSSSSQRHKQSAEGVRRRVSDASFVAEDKEIMIWKPWSEVTVSLPSTTRSQLVQQQAILCSRFIVK